MFFLINKLFLKEIENVAVKDQEIINIIINLTKQDETNLRRVRSARIGNDYFSVLHMAAKFNRATLCDFLIDKIKFGNYLNFFYLVNEKFRSKFFNF